MTSEAYSQWLARAAPAVFAHGAPEIVVPDDAVMADAGLAASPSGESTVIDCDRCTMRGIGCGDCVVTVLLGGPPYGVELDDAERRAIDVLARAGLVPPLRMVEPLDARQVHPE